MITGLYIFNYVGIDLQQYYMVYKNKLHIEIIV